MPFVVNLASEGRNWLDQSITRTQVLTVSEPVRQYAPVIFAWMIGRVEDCVAKGWLRDA